MKATAFSSQSVTTLADAVVMGVKRHAASNNHALLRVMAVLRDMGNVWPRRRGYRPQQGPAVEPTHAEHGGFCPLSRCLVYHRLRLTRASRQVLGGDLNPSESSRPALPFAPPHGTTASCSKGRLIRCTVPGLTPNCLAMTRTPGLPGVARASRIRFSSAGTIGGRPRRLPSSLARARPARTLSAIIARSNSANTPII